MPTRPPEYAHTSPHARARELPQQHRVLARATRAWVPPQDMHATHSGARATAAPAATSSVLDASSSTKSRQAASRWPSSGRITCCNMHVALWCSMHGALAQHVPCCNLHAWCYGATCYGAACVLCSNLHGAWRNVNHYVAIRGGQTAADGILHATLQTGSGQQTTWQRS
jgi:hypothetical protein